MYDSISVDIGKVINTVNIYTLVNRFHMAYMLNNNQIDLCTLRIF